MKDGKGELVTHAQMLGVELKGLLCALGELEVVGLARAVGTVGIIEQVSGQSGPTAFEVVQAYTQLRELRVGVGKFAAPLAAKGIQLLCNDLTAQACGLGAPTLPTAGERYGCADQIAGEGCSAIEGLVEATALQAGCPLAALEFRIRVGHVGSLFQAIDDVNADFAEVRGQRLPVRVAALPFVPHSYKR